MIIQNNDKMRVEVNFSVDPTEESLDGKLRVVEVKRHEVRYPVSPGGRVGWSKGEHTTVSLGTVRAEEIPALVSSLTQVLVFTPGVDRRWV